MGKASVSKLDRSLFFLPRIRFHTRFTPASPQLQRTALSFFAKRGERPSKPLYFAYPCGMGAPLQNKGGGKYVFRSAMVLVAVDRSGAAHLHPLQNQISQVVDKAPAEQGPAQEMG